MTRKNIKNGTIKKLRDIAIRFFNIMEGLMIHLNLVLMEYL
jgi:hypothetical protein